MALRKINVAVCMFSRHCQLAINLSTSNWTSTQLSQLEQTARHASSSLSWEPFRRHADATATSRKVVVAGLLGLPNSGKSQLANALCGKRVTAVSAYEHTTDKLKVAAYTLGRSQVVLRDLPGILDQRMPGSIDKKAVWDAAGECHVLLLVMDVHKLLYPGFTEAERLASQAASFMAQLHKTSLAAQGAQHRRSPVLLILNKIDQLKDLPAGRVKGASSSSRSREPIKGSLPGSSKFPQHGMVVPAQTLTYQSWEQALSSLQRRLERVLLFERVFRLSALTGEGVTDLRDFLAKLAQRGPWLLPAGEATDAPPHALAHELVRSRLLQALPRLSGLSPSEVQLDSTAMEEDGMGMHFTLALTVTNTPAKDALLGQAGQFLSKRIIQPAERDLSEALGMPASVHVDVRVTSMGRGPRRGAQRSEATGADASQAAPGPSRAEQKGMQGTK